jgi:hypothetical protein
MALFFCGMLQSQKTIALKEGMEAPKARLSQMSWMTGHWKGEAFGGTTEEIWSPPAGGSMMFVFRLIVNDAVNFYEIGHIREHEGTLWFELKHFGTDLKGWEEKDEVQRFRLIKIADNSAYFDGFTFERVDQNEINIYALIQNNEGAEEEYTFNYKRQ